MFRFIRRHFKKLVAMKRGSNFRFGDIVNVRQDAGMYILPGSAIMATRFVHIDVYGNILNRFEYLFKYLYQDGRIDDLWIAEKYIERANDETEIDMTVCN